MADRWFYSRGQGRIGPCTGRQLKDLAASGGILPTDTVWKEGVEKGATAARVKHLFAPSAQAPPGPGPAAAPELLQSTDGVGLVPLAPEAKAPVPAAASRRPAQQGQPRKGTAVAGSGALIVGQD